ncbi:MAG: phosphoribosylaminoimidazolesuccinocarboxamide synthase [Planctomycetota bacterium]
MAEVYRIEDGGETLPSGVLETDLPGVALAGRGKVRDIYDLGDQLLVIATDRISAFDSVLGSPIPDKGRILTQLSVFWFDFLKDIVPNHYLDDGLDRLDLSDATRRVLAGRSMRVHKAEVLPVECIVRGYLVGSGWKEYQASGTVCGMPLREGYAQAERLDEPIFTPSTKAEQGLHDENISFERMVEIIGADRAEEVRRASLALYLAAAEHARTQGILIADTKFEFGLVDGTLTLIDEVLTPDSSRFWDAATYTTGQNPPSFDKQFVRDWLDNVSGWNHEPPAPSLPPEVVQQTRAKYAEAYQRITGRPFEA